MDILFKIKHYVKPYFKRSGQFSASRNLNLKKIEKRYWIEGFEKNITNKKWKIEDNIPLGLYNGKWETHISKRTHISGLCEYFFALGETNQIEKQFIIIDFLLKHLEKGYENNNQTEYLFWKTYISESSSRYFVHGMGQGQILSVLTRANSINFPTNIDDKILLVANSFKLNSQNRDAFITRLEDNLVIQEYPHLLHEGSSVLNGWIFGLLGIYDLIIYGLADDEIKYIFKKSIKSLEKILPKYNLGYWSTYSLPNSYKNICSYHYHSLHVVLLESLGKISNNDQIKKYSMIFESQLSNIFYRILAFFMKIFANLIKYKRFYKIR